MTSKRKKAIKIMVAIFCIFGRRLCQRDARCFIIMATRTECDRFHGFGFGNSGATGL